MLGDAAGNDAAVMLEVGIDVERHAVIGHPAPHPHADRGDLGLAGAMLDPDADPALAPLAVDFEACERANHPFFEVVDVAVHVLTAAGEIEHDIGDALPRPVIGVLPAAPGAMYRKAPGSEEVLVTGASPGGVKRWMLQ